MPASVLLKRNKQASGTAHGRLGYRIVIEATGTNGIESEIFRYLRRPKDPSVTDGTQEDVFSGVCTLEELASLPINNPREHEEPKWLRLAIADLICSSEEQALEVWTKITEDVYALLNAHKISQVMNEEETLTIP